MPEKGPCEGTHEKCSICKGGEIKEGILGAPHKKSGARRVRGCNDPTARGKRNRARGKRKQREARRAIGVADSPVPNSLADEESWGGPVRAEVKSGKQIQPIATRFFAAKSQSDKGADPDDDRIFVLVAMPTNSTDGMVTMLLSDFKETILPLLEDKA